MRSPPTFLGRRRKSASRHIATSIGVNPSDGLFHVPSSSLLFFTTDVLVTLGKGLRGMTARLRASACLHEQARLHGCALACWRGKNVNMGDTELKDRELQFSGFCGTMEGWVCGTVDKGQQCNGVDAAPHLYYICTVLLCSAEEQ
jgi:hypothetical protein